MSANIMSCLWGPTRIHPCVSIASERCRVYQSPKRSKGWNSEYVEDLYRFNIDYNPTAPKHHMELRLCLRQSITLNIYISLQLHLRQQPISDASCYSIADFSSTHRNISDHVVLLVRIIWVLSSMHIQLLPSRIIATPPKSAIPYWSTSKG